jgi:multisubunit Na+/H+ antiporter MnhB subunit
MKDKNFAIMIVGMIMVLVGFYYIIFESEMILQVDVLSYLMWLFVGIGTTLYLYSMVKLDEWEKEILKR